MLEKIPDISAKLFLEIIMSLVFKQVDMFKSTLILMCLHNEQTIYTQKNDFMPEIIKRGSFLDKK